MSRIIVHKFGSSVLPSEASLPVAVDEIYAALRAGNRVVAVVSAFGDTTDRLLEKARGFGPRPESSAQATLLSTGELTAAALLVLALRRAGVAATLLDAGEIQLCTQGEPLDAEPVSVDEGRILDALVTHSVVVVPGFAGRDPDRRVTLLGRGGTDLTALFLAQALDADCVLFKDVDGIYEGDPRRDPSVRRYQLLSWQRAIEIGGEVVQPKAVAFAACHRLTIRVRAPRRADGTLIGAHNDVLASVRAPRRKRVLLLGLGTVGLGVLRRLRETPELFEVTGIAVRVADKPRPDDVSRELLELELGAALARDYDILVECIGGREPAGSAVELALCSGRDVVTANKELIEADGMRLRALAHRHRARLHYSAAVGGAVPCVEATRRLARDDRISEVRGVLNGTCNFVLDRLAEQTSWPEALRLAAEAGFAEADPSDDIDGIDAGRKLAILVTEAFGSRVDAADIPLASIRTVSPADAREAFLRGERLRLVAEARRDDSGLRARVALRALPLSDPLAAAVDEENVLALETERGTELWHGKGAGRWPTAQAVIADLRDLVLGSEARP